ncbi:MAG: T9SS type A sorting domain-containing protein [Rhodothermales bacterium]|nr:T9SS type A sorting domain-containing protein [Rhodothermales bacterium]
MLTLKLSESNATTVYVYDILGRVVEVLADGYLDSGTHEFRFDASNLPSGIYVYNVLSGQSRAAGTLNLIR